jgi:hypothetical protein
VAYYFYPLSDLLPDALIPEELVDLIDRTPLERLGVTDYRVGSIKDGVTIEAELGLDPAATEPPELVLGMPSFPDLGMVLRDIGRASLDITNEPAVRIALGAFAIRLPSTLLRPVFPNPQGGWLPDPARAFAEVDLAYAAADGVTDPHPLVLTVDGRGRFDLDAALVGGVEVHPVASLNGPAMIADTGVVIDVRRLTFSLDPDDPWLAFDEAEVVLPSDLTGSLVLPRILLEGARLGREGLTGTATVAWPLEFVGGRFTYALDDGTQDAGLFGLSGGLRQISVALEDNRLIAFEANGGLVIPYFDEPVDVRLDLRPGGDFEVTLAGLDSEGLTLRREELLALNLRSLTMAKDGDLGAVIVSGGLEPLVMASDGLVWPRLEVTDLMIDSQGHFRIREAWLDLKELATLDLFGFHFELARIGLGYEDPRAGATAGRLWVDLSGSLRLIEQIPVGLAVDGFRLSWPENLDQLVGLAGPPSIDQALAILGQLEIRFEGIQLLFGVPDAVEFEGLIRFIKDTQSVGFAGDVALRVPPSGFALEAGLLVGMNFEPPPFPFLYVYFGVELPAGIPLGQSGLALKGAKGLFGLNVVPAKAPEANWYYDWYRTPPEGAHPTPKWTNARGALAFGAGLTITTADGYVKGVRGLLVLSLPGPVLIIEGKALILDFLTGDEPPFGALAVFDGVQHTVQFNIEAQAELVEDVLEAHGGVEAFFDFNDVTNWHLYLGQDEPPERRIEAGILKVPDTEDWLFDANAYLMLDMVGGTTFRSRMGISVGFQQSFDDYDPFIVDIDASIRGDGTVTVLPEQFSGEAELSAKVEISIWDIGVQLAARAQVASEGPEPFRVEATLEVTADMPDPAEDFEAELTFRWESPPRPDPMSPLIGLVVDSELAPGGGAVDPIQATIRPVDDGGHPVDVLARLADGGELVAAGAAQTAAEGSPVVPLDSRPTLLFGHDMNDETGGLFGRDGDGTNTTHRIGQLSLAPTLRDVALYRHPKADPWTGDFTADWHLVAASDPDVADAEPGAEPLWGVWLADTAAENPASPGARRLRLWAANPFVGARGELGSGYPQPFGFAGHGRTSSEAFLGDHPEFFECRRTSAEETCVDFTEAPKPPKKDDGPATWSYGGMTFSGATELTGGMGGPCLAVQGRLTVAFLEPLQRVRIRFCKDPGISQNAAQGRVVVRGVRPGGIPGCGEPVGFDLAVEATSWVVTAADAEPITCLELTPPAPLAGFCLVTTSEVARAERSSEQCESNDTLVAQLGVASPVLAPGAYYRLVAASTVEATVLPSPDGPVAAILDELYETALEVLAGEQEPRLNGFVHEAFFQTDSPPTSLERYVKWSSPFPDAPRFFREDDLVIRFRRSYIEELYRDAPHGLEITVRDAQGREVPGFDTEWRSAPSATLLPDERLWRERVDAPPPPTDNLLIARHGLIFAETFNESTLKAWHPLAAGPSRNPPTWSVQDGELLGPGGSGARVRRAEATGAMLISTAPQMPSAYRLDAELRAPTGDPVGVVFGVLNERSWYRFSMDDRARFRRLVRMDNGTARTLHETREGDERGRSHEVSVQAIPGPDGLQIAISIDGTAWATIVDATPLPGRRVGVWNSGAGEARFSGVRARIAESDVPPLAPRQRYELLVRNPADPGRTLHRAAFVTSAFARFRDLVSSFTGDAPAIDSAGPSAADLTSIIAAQEHFATERTAHAAAVVAFRDQELDRAGVEAKALRHRTEQAALDDAFRELADLMRIPWLDPRTDRLQVRTLTPDVSAAGGPIAGFWVRTPESLDLQFGAADGTVGRTTVELEQQANGDSTWDVVAITVFATSDSVDALVLPAAALNSTAPVGWPAATYRLTFTYRRNLSMDSADDRSTTPVEQRFGSDAPELVSIEWSA